MLLYGINHHRYGVTKQSYCYQPEGFTYSRSMLQDVQEKTKSSHICCSFEANTYTRLVMVQKDSYIYEKATHSSAASTSQSKHFYHHNTHRNSENDKLKSLLLPILTEVCQ